MKNLPHQKPIKFVEEILKKEGEYIYLSCTFPSLPTLAMICEAAAQSSASFKECEEPKIGFLLSLKDVELFKECDILKFQIKIKKVATFDLLTEFSFELIDKNIIYAKGTLIVKIQE